MIARVYSALYLPLCAMRASAILRYVRVLMPLSLPDCCQMSDRVDILMPSLLLCLSVSSYAYLSLVIRCRDGRFTLFAITIFAAPDIRR